MATSIGLMVVGLGLGVPLAARYVADGLTFKRDVLPWSHLAVVGLLALIAGFATFTFTLVLHAAAQPGIRREPRQ
jgi:hypothetical protein